MFNILKRKKKLDYKLISDPTKSINLDNDGILVSYAIGFFTGITVGGNRCDKDSVELAKKLIRLLQERGLEHKVFSSYSIGHLTKFDLDDIPMPKVKPPKQEDDRHPLQEGYMPEGNDGDAIPTTNGSGVGKSNKNRWRYVNGINKFDY